MAKEKGVYGPRRATGIDREIGRNIRQLRLTAGLPQQEVAAVLGVTFQQVQKYENGSNRLPLAMLLKLKCLYDVPYEYFFIGLAEEKIKAKKKSLPVYDNETARLCRRLAAINDYTLKHKIGKIIEVLAS
jgi:transcriptional regulator with XRE-family HTH domain